MILLATLAVFALVPGARALNLLANPSFEDAAGGAPPTSWSAFADAAAASNALPHSGARGVNVSATGGAGSYGILYQRYYGAVAQASVYSMSVWARGGAGRVSIEFFDGSGNKLDENVSSFGAAAAWTQRFASLAAPPGAVAISAVVGAEDNGGGGGAAAAAVLLDDASLDRVSEPAFAFDLRDALPGAFEGFGVNTWASMTEGNKLLGALGLRHVRATQDGDSDEQMRGLRELTASLGVSWLYQLWAAPDRFVTNGMLSDVTGFAAYWVSEVARLAAAGACPDAIDLMNEPDSGGAWSTGIAPADYSALVGDTRRRLDAAGFANVSIFGPGLVVLSNEPQWVSALDAAAANATGRFASHAYDDGPGMPGRATMEADFPLFASAVRAKSPSTTALFVTEFATHNYRYNGYEYPDADETPAGSYSVSDSLPFAVRVVENTLAMLNEGATALFYWCAQDAGGKSWGYVDGAGRRKPVFFAQLNLFPRLAVGARTLRGGGAGASGDSDLTLGAFALPPAAAGGAGGGSGGSSSILVAASNAGQVAEAATLTLAGCPAGGLRLVNATAFIGTRLGNPAAGEWDEAALVPAAPGQVAGALAACELRLELPALSTLSVELELVGGPLA